MGVMVPVARAIYAANGACSMSKALCDTTPSNSRGSSCSTIVELLAQNPCMVRVVWAYFHLAL